MYRQEQDLNRKCTVRQLTRCDVNVIISSLQNIFNMCTRGILLYDVINCYCLQQFSWNLTNMSLYALLQIYQSSNMSLVDTILQASPQPEITWIGIRRPSWPRIWKRSGDNAFMCEGFTKQTLNLATDMRWCPILHKNSGLITVTFLPWAAR